MGEHSVLRDQPVDACSYLTLRTPPPHAMSSTLQLQQHQWRADLC